MEYHVQVHIRLRDRTGMDIGCPVLGHHERDVWALDLYRIRGHLPPLHAMLRAIPFPPEHLCFLGLKLIGSEQESE